MLFAYLASPTFPNTPALSQHCSCHIIGKCVNPCFLPGHLSLRACSSSLTWPHPPTHHHLVGTASVPSQVSVCMPQKSLFPGALCLPGHTHLPPTHLHLVGTACVTLQLSGKRVLIMSVLVSHQATSFCLWGYTVLALPGTTPTFQNSRCWGREVGVGGWGLGFCLMLHRHHPTSFCLWQYTVFVLPGATPTFQNSWCGGGGGGEGTLPDATLSPPECLLAN